MEQWDKPALWNSSTRLLALMEWIRIIHNHRQCHLGLTMDYVLCSHSFKIDNVKTCIHPNNWAIIYKTNMKALFSTYHHKLCLRSLPYKPCSKAYSLAFLGEYWFKEHRHYLYYLNCVYHFIQHMWHYEGFVTKLFLCNHC